MVDKDVSAEVVAMKILLIRGKKLMLDRDPAELYGVKAIAMFHLAIRPAFF